MPDMSVVHWWNHDWQGKTDNVREKPASVLLPTRQIPHGLTWDWIRSSAVRSA